MQAEFDLAANATLAAEQRLKGSFPWVFAFDGKEFRFVKDFLWRSPLGLRVNAQATAGVVQTEDWIKISADQLSPLNGRYHLRITAELWETHFFDHVAMVAVDHPDDVEVFVDERFVPNEAQAHRVVVATLPAHGIHEYAGPLVPLEFDPVYLRYRDDWRLYHTRFVAPRRFAQRLWQPRPRWARRNFHP